MKKSMAGAVIAILAMAGQSVAVEQVTFYGKVLPILQENCQVCHRPGGANLGGMVAPMAFETYGETRPWAKSIARSVASREMPPWHADPKHHGQFSNERTLTQEDIDTLVAWVGQGSRRGNPGDAPAGKDWPDTDGWTIGEPDLVIEMPRAYFVNDEVEDIYVDFHTRITEEMLPGQRFIKAVEFRPGSPAVHHIIAMPLGGIAPGNDPSVYPDGISAPLKPGTTVTWQMHYHKEPGPGTGVLDLSKAAVKFYPEGARIDYIMKGNHLGRFDFSIPPGEGNYTIEKTYTFSEDSQIVSFMPHFHLRGKAAKYEAFYPDGSSEVLLDVPRYDFNWQTSYKYGEFKQVPEGTKLVFTATFDNSEDNPYNPDPAQTVRWGEPTTDEMSFGYMSFINEDPAPEPMFGRRSGNGQIDLADVVEMFDVNKDGLLQRDEAPGRLKSAFSLIDSNKDGGISAEEAEVAMERFNRARQGSAGTG